MKPWFQIFRQDCRRADLRGLDYDLTKHGYIPQAIHSIVVDENDRYVLVLVLPLFLEVFDIVSYS